MAAARRQLSLRGDLQVNVTSHYKPWAPIASSVTMPDHCSLDKVDHASQGYWSVFLRVYSRWAWRAWPYEALWYLGYHHYFSLWMIVSVVGTRNRLFAGNLFVMVASTLATRCGTTGTEFHNVALKHTECRGLEYCPQWLDSQSYIRWWINQWHFSENHTVLK